MGNQMSQTSNNLIKYFQSKNYWFDNERWQHVSNHREDYFTLNCINPSEEIDMMGEEGGNIFEAIVQEDERIRARYIYDQDNINKTWVFDNVEQFITFYELFLNQGFFAADHYAQQGI
jgi:hypothetical protein